jgi:hypothetical protein
VHAAGLLGVVLPVVAGHGASPSGVDAIPGAIAAAVSWVMHAAPGPDAGHSAEPDGTLRLTSSSVAAVVHPCWAAALSTPAEQTGTPRCSARTEIRAEGGAAASATKLIWFETRAKARARCALGRVLTSDTS